MASIEDISRAVAKLSDDQRADVLALVEQLAAGPFYDALPDHALRAIDQGLAEYGAGQTIAASDIMADIRRRAADNKGPMAAE